jgi:hypothetical protein
MIFKIKRELLDSEYETTLDTLDDIADYRSDFYNEHCATLAGKKIIMEHRYNNLRRRLKWSPTLREYFRKPRVNFEEIYYFEEYLVDNIAQPINEDRFHKEDINDYQHEFKDCFYLENHIVTKPDGSESNFLELTPTITLDQVIMSMSFDIFEGICNGLYYAEIYNNWYE